MALDALAVVAQTSQLAVDRSVPFAEARKLLVGVGLLLRPLRRRLHDSSSVSGIVFTLHARKRETPGRRRRDARETLSGEFLPEGRDPVVPVSIRVVCGRYTLTEPAGIQLRFGLVAQSETRLRPRFDIAPSQGVPIVVQTRRGRELRAAGWGFNPVWMREDARRPPPSNARAETAATNGLFRDALERRRCLVVADGFFEFIWTGGGAG
jgi:hypothetical protein